MKRGASLHLLLSLGLVVGVLASVAPVAQAAASQPPRRLTISKAATPTGSVAQGRVTTSTTGAISGGADCGTTCTTQTVSYDRYSAVTITATPDANSDVASFSNCTRTPNTNECTIASLSNDTTVLVTFSAKQALTVVKSAENAEGGGGTVTATSTGVLGFSDGCVGGLCSTSSKETFGATVALTATANATSKFVGWSGACTTSSAICTVTMNGPLTATATFRATYLITASTSSVGGGSGTLTVNGAACADPCDLRRTSAESVTVIASAAAGSTFLGWTGTNVPASCANTGTTCAATMDRDRAITARFASVKSVTVGVVGPAGSVDIAPGGTSCSTVSCARSFAYDTEVTLTARPVDGVRFLGWSGAGIGSCGMDPVCTFTVLGDATPTATFGPLSRLLVVRDLAGPALGTVTATSGAAIDCGSTCGAWVVPGSTVVLEASEGADTRWDGWSGACAELVADATYAGRICTVTLDASETVTASFVALRTLTLHSVATGGFGGTVALTGGTTCAGDCTSKWDEGALVTLEAQPVTDATFVWSGDRDACSATASQCTVTMDRARDITVTFSQIRYPLSVAFAGTGGGKVAGKVGDSVAFTDCTGACAPTVPIHSSVTLTATASPGSRFSGWSGEGCSGTGTCVVTMEGARSVTATFVPISVLTLTVSGSGVDDKVLLPAGNVTLPSQCTTSCTATYDASETITLTAVPTTTTGAETMVGSWSGYCSGSGSTCVVPMSQARTVGITFVPLSYTLTVSRSLLGTGLGTVTSDGGEIACGGAGTVCAASFPIRTVVVLTATPGTNSVFTSWSGSCSGTLPTCTVTMDAARSAVATFASLETLTVGKTGDGTGTFSSADGTISCDEACRSVSKVLPYGTSVTITATATGTSTFGGWSVNGCKQARCSITVNGTTSLNATFNPPSYTLTLTKKGTGSITSDPVGLSCTGNCTGASASFAVGSSVLLTATVPTGGYFSGWGGACASAGVSRTCTVTMSSAISVSADFGSPTLTITKQRWLNGNGSITTASSPATKTKAISCGTSCTSVSGTYAPLSTVTITASPAAGSGFAGWGGACAGQVGLVCTISMDRTLSVVVNFGTRVSVSIGMNGSGSVALATPEGTTTCTATCLQTVAAGATVTFSGQASSGWAFERWDGICAPDPTNATCSMQVMADLAALAFFRSLP